MSQSTQISTFKFESNSIRTLAINNEPWFIAKDVCDAIGIENNRKALMALDDDEKGVTLSNTLGGEQEMNIVSESGMYTLILRCRDAVKKGSVPHRFRKWVTAEVLPQIRKTGQYQVQQLALPEPEPKISKALAQNDWLHFASHWFALYNMLGLLADLEEPLQAIGSHYAVTAYTHVREYVNTLNRSKQIIEPLLAEFEVDPVDKAHIHLALKTLRNYQAKGLKALR